MNRFLVLLPAFCLVATIAHANTELKVMGGAGSIKTIQTKQKDIETKLKVKMTFAEGTSEKGATAVAKGFIDVASLAENPEATTKRLIENNTISGAKLEDFEWVKYTEQSIHISVSEKNPVSTLNDEQIKGIVTGKIKNWSEVGGPDLKILPCMAKATFITNKKVLSDYNEGKESAAIQYVVDQSGINNMVKAEAGVACFTTTKSPTGAKQIPMNSKIPSYFFYKKSASKMVKDFVSTYMAN